MTLQELIERALELMDTDEEFEPCCGKRSHRAEALMTAMVAVDAMDATRKPELVSTISGPVDELERFEFVNVTARVHPRSRCDGDFCVLHNPSNHRMVDWPMVLRETALVERLCVHGVGHPDPDSAQWMDERFNPGVRVWGMHGCDGCCS